MQTKANNKEVYRVTGFSDIIESPVFYLILVLTFILGISSIFGFLQNPRKLKSVVDVINTKVALYDSKFADKGHQGVSHNKYSVIYNLSSTSVNSTTKVDNSRYSLLSKDVFINNYHHDASVTPVSFDYDITSDQFWSDLLLDTLDQNVNSPSLGGQLLGTPITPFGSPLKREEGSYKYSMKNRLTKSI